MSFEIEEDYNSEAFRNKEIETQKAEMYEDKQKELFDRVLQENMESIVNNNAGFIEDIGLSIKQGLKYVTNFVDDATSIYNGFINVDGQASGYGKLTKPNGKIYEGNWDKNDLLIGNLYLDGNIYKGEWKNGILVRTEPYNINGDIYDDENQFEGIIPVEKPIIGTIKQQKKLPPPRPRTRIRQPEPTERKGTSFGGKRKKTKRRKTKKRRGRYSKNRF